MAYESVLLDRSLVSEQALRDAVEQIPFSPTVLSGHRGPLKRPGQSSSLQDLVRMVLGIQLPPRFIDVKDQLAVLNPLTRLCV